MYIEETGQGDGDIKITVEGEEYTAEANYDLDGDGIDDAAVVVSDDGHVAYVDENADGRADLMQTANADGAVVEQARFQAETGDWVGESPAAPHGPPEERGGDPVVVETVMGELRLGPATEDTDGNGRADTAVVTTGTGTVLATDVDGDGSADQLVEITDQGEVVVSRHAGNGEWDVVEESSLDATSGFAPDAAVGTDDATWSFDEDREQERSSGRGGASGGARPDSDALWA